MNKNTFYISIIISIILSSCGSDLADKELFNGEIRTINDKNVIIKEMKAKSVVLDGVYSGVITVFDSLLVCWDPRYKDYCFNMFNVDTGDKIGDFGPKGQGPKEFAHSTPVFRFYEKDGDIIALVNGNLKSLALWNITKSISSSATVYDTIIPRSLGLYNYLLPGDSLLNIVSAQSLDLEHTSTPYFETGQLLSDQEPRKTPIYKQEILDNSKTHSLSIILASSDALKPDGTKFVQAMAYLPQLNIIDPHSGEIVAFRAKGGPGYSILQSDTDNLKFYYSSAQADDKYIYASYWGEEEKYDQDMLPEINEIHVFDWDGNLCYKLTTDQSFINTSLDPIRNRLYTLNRNTDNIYYLDLNEVL